LQKFNGFGRRNKTGIASAARKLATRELGVLDRWAFNVMIASGANRGERCVTMFAFEHFPKIWDN
jgi:hypothetical protein